MTLRKIGPAEVIRNPEPVAVPAAVKPSVTPQATLEAALAAAEARTRTPSTDEPSAATTRGGRGLAQVALRLKPPATPRPLLDTLSATLVPAQTQDLGPLADAPSAIAGVPVQSARAVRFTGLTGHNVLQQQGAELTFGPLSEAAFKALHAELGGHSAVAHAPGRSYTLVDFLPPPLQALVNRDLDSGPAVKLPGTAHLRALEDERDFSVALSPNCHGTAWEAMRVYQGQRDAVSVYLGDATTASIALDDAARLQTLGRAEPGATPEFLGALRPGDLVTFHRHSADFGDLELLHSMVHVGGGMFFEKPDTEMDEYSETPYRLVTFAQAVAPIADYLGEAPSVVARRPRPDLPSPTELFGSGQAADLEAWAQQRGTTLGRPLLTELELTMGGGTRGVHVTAMDTLPVTIGPDGRGRVA